jgi:hypothetical protein
VSDTERQRLTVLTWATGITAALMIAVLGMVMNLSFQVGQIAGELNVLISHVTLK